MVAVNPLPEAGLFNFKDPQTVSGVVGKGTVGGDLALFQALGHLLLAEEERNPGTVVNRSFIDAQTDGFAAYREARRDVDWAETGKAMVNVLLLQGNFGKPGAGACPVRGHSNVHGDRTMAIWENPKEWLLDALDAEFGIESPRHHGYDAVEAMEAFERDGVDVFMSMGGNFSLACSDTETLETGMQRIGLTVHVSTKPNRSHIIARMADATFGQGHAVDWKAMAADYDVVRDHISRVIPGFEDFNTRVRTKNGFVLSNPPRDTRSFKTDIGRGRFTVSPLEYLSPPDSHLVAYATAKGCAAAYSPEANALVHKENVARESNTPGFKALFVRFVPHANKDELTG